MAKDVEFETRAHYRAYTVFIVCFMCIGSIAYGFAAANIGITLGQPSFIAHLHLDTDKNVAALLGAMNGLWYGGGFVGAILQGWIGNKFGRKASIATGCAFIVVSGGILTGSVNVAMFIAIRFFNGLGCFMLLAGVPLWVTEIVPPAHRGLLADIHAIGLNAGYCISAYCGVGFYYTHGKDAWRPPVALQMVPPLIVLCGIYWIPESPRWLISKNRTEEAWKIIRRLHSDPTDSTDDFARREFYQMRLQIEFERSLKTTYWEIFRKPSFRKRAFMTMFLTATLFSSGILVVNTYGALLYASLGYGTADSLQFQSGYIAVALATNIIAMAFVDKVRRNWLISFGFFTCMVCMIAETALQKIYIGTGNKAGLGGAVAALYLFVACYSLFVDGPCYFYIAEIWPTHLRAQGYTMGIAALAASNILWLEAAPTAFQNIGWRYYIVFIVFCALGCVVTLSWFPNTLHKPLEEVAAMFGDHDLVMLYQKDIANQDLSEAKGVDILHDTKTADVSHETKKADFETSEQIEDLV